jgi:pimeloyl-ACP methyl ester carboxylesterase
MEIAPKPALLFLPGLLCDRFVWEYQTRVLGDWAECRVVEWTAEDSLAAMAQTVVLDAPERFTLAGHSMGGRVALEVYRLAPQRVTGIALLDTGYLPCPADASGQEEAHGRYALLEVARSQGMRAMARQWIPPMIHPMRRSDRVFTGAIEDMFARKTPDVFAAQIKALLSRPDSTAVLGAIQCPALLLTGREDTWSPPERHAAMAAMIPGSRVVIVPECGHMSTLEQPAAAADALRFVVETAATGSAAGFHSRV